MNRWIKLLIRSRSKSQARLRPGFLRRMNARREWLQEREPDLETSAPCGLANVAPHDLHRPGSVIIGSQCRGAAGLYIPIWSTRPKAANQP